jgi:glyoxylase-like metal-dependent hydrolase (beta-lactamase superfamily II)
MCADFASFEPQPADRAEPEAPCEAGACVSGLTKISDHIYWLPPGPPDRPSLCAVVGERRTMMLDAGSSAAHARIVLDALSAAAARLPSLIALTHWHWDHVFGAAEIGAPVIAHRETAAKLLELAETDWSDEALDRRVAEGLDSEGHAANVKAELPSPRQVEVALADVVFDLELEVELGGVTVRVKHVGGDHASDSCVMYVEPDRLLFLGDCLYESLGDGYTAAQTLPLHEAVLGFGAEHFVEGHGEEAYGRPELDEYLEEIRAAAAG